MKEARVATIPLCKRSAAAKGNLPVTIMMMVMMVMMMVVVNRARHPAIPIPIIAVVVIPARIVVVVMVVVMVMLVTITTTPILRFHQPGGGIARRGVGLHQPTLRVRHGREKICVTGSRRYGIGNSGRGE